MKIEIAEQITFDVEQGMDRGIWTMKDIETELGLEEEAK